MISTLAPALAAITAAERGAQVTLLEPNERLGKKLNITGKGRCNVTNNCTAAEVLQNTPRNPRFLYSAMENFPPNKIMELLEEVNRRGTTVVVVTHNQEIVDMMQKRVITLSKGILIGDEQKGGYSYENSNISI